MLFHRRPFRPEFHGEAGLLRLTGTRHTSMANQLSLPLKRACRGSGLGVPVSRRNAISALDLG